MGCVHLNENIVICGMGGWQHATRYFLWIPTGPGVKDEKKMWWQHRRRHQMHATCCKRKRWACYLWIKPAAYYDFWPTRCKDGHGCAPLRQAA